MEKIKDPPAEYAEKVQAPYDFWAEWERIYATAKADHYDNEHQFGFDLYEAFQKTHDGHFVLYPDSVAEVFTWSRRTPLVSVSVDGVSIPEVYVYQDILDRVAGNASYTPSPLTLINERNSTEFLLEWAQNGNLHDPDALWNDMFYQLQATSIGAPGNGIGTFSGGGRGRFIYPGANTTLTFANGSSSTYENFARVLPSFENITSGADLYKELFTPPSRKAAKKLATSSTTKSSSTTTSTPTTTTPAPGSPTPIIRQEANLNSGYFLDGEEYDDVAVLSVASFVGSETDGISFQAVNTHFLERAIAENKTKLIIDLSANGGGNLLQAYDLFIQLFPHTKPYVGGRYRVHEAFDLIGREISYLSGLVNRSLDLNDTIRGYVSSPLNYRSDIDSNGHNFQSWEEKVGPQLLGPQLDTFTPIYQLNLSDALGPDRAGGINVTGFGNRTNISERKFRPENIVMVTDGVCASTCAIFSEFMRQQAGVKTISLGGRPNRDITQAVGGVKGTIIMKFSNVLGIARVPLKYQYIHSAEFYNNTALGDYNDLFSHRTKAAAVNGGDGFRQGDTSNVPLQFKYEPADCRVYYTPEMTVDMTVVWKTVADTAFNGVDHCIAGGIESKGGRKRAAGERKKHAIRSDLDTREHREAIATHDQTEIVLYDLACTKGVCFSPVVWRIRMMLNYKKIAYKSVFLEFPDIEPTLKELGIPPQPHGTPYTVPAIHHIPTNKYIMDSPAIAAFLEKTYPNLPVPLESELGDKIRADSRDIAATVLRNSLMPREVHILSPRGAAHFRITREAALGHSLEDLLPPPDKEDEAWASIEGAMHANGKMMKTREAEGPFIEGETPGYVDFAMVGNMQCARVIDEGGWRRLYRIQGYGGLYDACKPWMERED
ncbi:hypothetical protein PRZ48_011725 [Zasmidium cellare]|uniref:Tail specific protease domain-containing protein n=1 Tax=Zasmidium cellare TaxID=395010 RepID=A0ABR0E7Q1_ZASCE|nr:hypothetical protein PRZ48_011725 [Zasmidium cellare]